METKNRLENILNRMESDEGRKRFVYDYLSNFGKDEIYQTIHNYADKGNFEIAAKIAENANLAYDASIYYEKSGEIGSAARNANKAGMKQKAIELYEKEGSVSFRDAAQIAEEIGMTQKAIKLYFQHYIDSGNLSSKKKVSDLSKKASLEHFVTDLTKESIKSLVNQNKFDLAIDLAENWEPDELQAIYEKSAPYYEKSKNLSKAIYCYEEIENFKKVSEIEEKRGHIFDAARAAEEAEDYKRAIDLYLKDKNFSCAAKVEKKRGNFSEAIDLYMKAIDQNKFNLDYPKEVALIALEQGTKETAIEFYGKAKLFYEAANLSKEMGYSEKADSLYKLALDKEESKNNFNEAEKIAKEAGFEEKVRFYQELNKLKRS